MLELEIKNKLIKKIKENPWQTPFYFYDLNQVEKNYQTLERALKSRFKIFYSMKSNPHSEVLKKLKSLGCLIDVSSEGETQKAFEAGFNPTEMSFVGPGKSLVELNLCLDNNIEYTVIESFQELELFSRLAKEKNKTPKFCLRINPDKFIHTNGQPKNNIPSHFGFDESEVIGLKNYFDNNQHIKLAGLHFYLQSQYLKSDYITQNFRYFTEITLNMQSVFKLKFEMLNFGGGFGIPYFEGQESLDLKSLDKDIQSFLAEDNTKQLDGVSFYVESGRFISGSAGTFVTKVQYLKKSHGKTFIICDGGMTQHQSSIGVGQVIRRHFPIEVVSMKTSDKSDKITLAGPSCYSIDILGAEVYLPVPEQGDFIFIGQSGAYGKSFSPENFLSRPMAGEYTNEDL